MTKCDKCGEGTMVQREGKHGKFIACDQYPECSNTERVVEKPMTDKEFVEAINPVVKKGTRTPAQVDQADYTKMAVSVFNSLWQTTTNRTDTMNMSIALVKQARDEFK